MSCGLGIIIALATGVNAGLEILPTQQLTELLVLRAAAQSAQGRLQAHLQKHADLQQASAASPWPLLPVHYQLAHRQRAALQLLAVKTLMYRNLCTVLQQAKPPPAALFVRGNAALLDTDAIGIVGSRRASVAALSYATDLARTCGKRGLVIVSGGACGVDAAAHQGALSVGAATVAYLGSPIDAPYPSRNRSLFRQILAAGGALVSEHPPCVASEPYHHAARNRFIAAHAQHLLVVEAAAQSGTLGTARYARQLGRPVFVPPASVGGERAGIDSLLQQGWAQVMPNFYSFEQVLS